MSVVTVHAFSAGAVVQADKVVLVQASSCKLAGVNVHLYQYVATDGYGILHGQAQAVSLRDVTSDFQELVGLGDYSSLFYSYYCRGYCCRPTTTWYRSMGTEPGYCIHICVDNIFRDFSSRFLAATVLVKAEWLADYPLERAFFGEAEVACLCKQVVFTGAQAADIVY